MVARKFASEGSNVAINYVSNRDAAEKVAAEIEAEYKVKTVIVQGVCLTFPPPPPCEYYYYCCCCLKLYISDNISRTEELKVIASRS